MHDEISNFLLPCPPCVEKGTRRAGVFPFYREMVMFTESRSRTRAGLRVRRRLLRVGSCFQQGAVGTVVGVSVLGADVEPERGWDG